MTTTKLRQRAEKLWRTRKKTAAMADGALLRAADARRLIHELEVHQIELEIEKEELQRSALLLQESRTKYAVLFNDAPVGYLVFDPDGRILQANSTAAELLGVPEEALIRTPFIRFLTPASRRTFYLHLKKARAGEAKETCELDLAAPAARNVFVESIIVHTPDAGALECHSTLTDITLRRKGEDLLKKSMATIKSVAAAVPIGLGIASDRDIQWVNDYFETLTGYTLKEIVGRNSRILYPTKREFDHVSRDFYVSLREKNTVALEVRWKRKDGKILNIYLTGSTLATGSRFPGVVFAAMDITENKNRDRAIQESAGRFKGVFDHASDGILIVDEKTGKFYLWNKAMVRILGRTERELKNMAIMDIHPASAAPFIRRQFDALAGGEAKIARDIPVLNKAGGTLFADITTAHLSFGGKSYIAGFFRDVTARKKAEEAARSAETRIHYLSKYANDIIILLDDHFNFLEVNDRTVECYGYTRKELLHMRAIQVRAPEARPSFARQVRVAQRTGAAMYETLHLRKDGTTFPVEINLRGMTIGHKCFYQAVIRDITERKKSENALTAANIHWKTTFDSIRDAIALLSLDGTILQCNKALTVLVGKPVSDVIGRKCWELIHGTSRPIPHCPFRRMLKSKKRESIIIRSDGKWLEATVDPIGDAFGTVTGAVHIITDITERKRREEAIAIFKRFTDTAGQGFGMATLDGNLVYANPSLAKILGAARPAGIIGKNIRCFYPPEPRSRLLREVLPVVREQERWTGESALLTRTGRAVPVIENFFLLRDAKGKPQYYANVITDITARKKAMDEAANWKQRYELIVAATSQVTYDYDIGSGQIFWGGEIEKVFGYPSARMRDDIVAWAAKIHPDDRKAATEALDAAMRKLAPYNVDYRFRHLDGHYLWVHDRGFFMTGPSGTAARMLGVMQDVTKMKSVEDERRELIRAVSHELKTPIGMAKMALDMFTHSLELNDRTRIDESCAILAKNISRLDKDVENILEIFSLESMRRIGRKERCAVGTVIGEVVERNRYIADAKKLAVRVTLPRCCGVVFMIRRDLMTLVNNLVDNALKFTDKGSVDVSARCRGRWVDITVIDTGIGISPAEKSRTLEYFYKGHPSLPGAGLGLPICQAITHRYGGKLEIVSQGSGKGTRSVATLPRSMKRG